MKFRHSVLCVMGVLLSAGWSFGQCDPQWSDQFGMRGVVSFVNASATWNDGTGSKVYLAGDFNRMDNIPYEGTTTGTHSIVSWNGSSWQTLGLGIGPAGPGQSGGKQVNALVVYDPDGSGGTLEALYAAGYFSRAGGSVANAVARWDGFSWSAVGSGISGVANAVPFSTLAVLAMAEADTDGSGPANSQLFIAGDFDKAGGVTVNSVARWNGSTWQAVGGAFPIRTRGQKLAVIDTDGPGPLGQSLFLAGIFSFAPDGSGGLIPTQGLARWDGTSWSDVPGIALDSTRGVVSMAAFDDGVNRSLFVCGYMTLDVGAGSAATIARLDLTTMTWTDLGTHEPFTVPVAHAMTQVGSRMYFSGSMNLPGQPFAGEHHIGYWSPAVLNTISRIAGVEGTTRYLGAADFDGPGVQAQKLVIGGNFPFIDGKAFSSVALYTGSAFETIPSTAGNTLGLGWGQQGSPMSVDVLEVLDVDGAGPEPEKLIVGGKFWGAGETTAINIAAFDGTSYTKFDLSPGDPGSTEFPTDFTVFHDGTSTNLYLATSALISGSSEIKKYNGSTFTSAGGVDGFCFDLLTYDDGSGNALWALGGFGQITDSTGTITVPARSVARMRPGFGWEAADAGIPTDATQTVGSPVVATIAGLTELYAIVYNQSVFTTQIMKWNGTQWSAIPSGIAAEDGGSVGFNDIIGFDGHLYACGHFSIINGVPVSGIARWNGSTWSALGAGFAHSEGELYTIPNFMVIHDDGTGDALYIIGRFTQAGGIDVPGVAKWTGTAWGASPPAILAQSIAANCAASYQGKLFIGGGFTAWGGESASGLTALVVPCDPCPADFNDSGSVTVQDIFDFLAAWFSGQPSADFNGVAGVSVQDIFDFLAAWFAGCH